ncbi:hypothetical protein BDR03DRAFT_970842 [Suillus americanus]|nr:hypothetical protein BDR03DRAFT_970842 [Suillus americanus]
MNDSCSSDYPIEHGAFCQALRFCYIWLPEASRQTRMGYRRPQRQNYLSNLCRVHGSNHLGHRITKCVLFAGLMFFNILNFLADNVGERCRFTIRLKSLEDGT